MMDSDALASPAPVLEALETSNPAEQNPPENRKKKQMWNERNEKINHSRSSEVYKSSCLAGLWDSHRFSFPSEHLGRSMDTSLVLGNPEITPQQRLSKFHFVLTGQVIAPGVTFPWRPRLPHHLTDPSIDSFHILTSPKPLRRFKAFGSVMKLPCFSRRRTLSRCGLQKSNDS